MPARRLAVPQMTTRQIRWDQEGVSRGAAAKALRQARQEQEEEEQLPYLQQVWPLAEAEFYSQEIS
jgi:hypothetical protein